jgi:hypothetical protein
MEIALRRRQRDPLILPPLALPFSRPPCEKISIVRSGPNTPQQLLRFGPRFGSLSCGIVGRLRLAISYQATLWVFVRKRQRPKTAAALSTTKVRARVPALPAREPAAAKA